MPHNEHGGPGAAYSMAAAALTTLARQKTGILKPLASNHASPMSLQLGANATLGRQLADMQARCEQAPFQTGM